MAAARAVERVQGEGLARRWQPGLQIQQGGMYESGGEGSKGQPEWRKRCFLFEDVCCCFSLVLLKVCFVF